MVCMCCEPMQPNTTIQAMLTWWYMTQCRRHLVLHNSQWFLLSLWSHADNKALTWWWTWFPLQLVRYQHLVRACRLRALGALRSKMFTWHLSLTFWGAVRVRLHMEFGLRTVYQGCSRWGAAVNFATVNLPESHSRESSQVTPKSLRLQKCQGQRSTDGELDIPLKLRISPSDSLSVYQLWHPAFTL